MKFYDCKVWICDSETALRVSEVVHTCLPACEIVLLRRLHNDNLTGVREVECTDEKKLAMTHAEWRDDMAARGYSRRVINREFDTRGPLPTTIDRPRRPAKATTVEDDEAELLGA
jgi:hypothetical protein